MFAMFFFASIPINPNRQFWIKVSATQFKLESKTLPLWVFSIEHMIEIDFVQHSFRVNIQVLTSFSKLKRSFCYLLSYTWQCFSVCVCVRFSRSFHFNSIGQLAKRNCQPNGTLIQSAQSVVVSMRIFRQRERGEKWSESLENPKQNWSASSNGMAMA